MIINNRDNFKPMIVRMLEGLGYTSIKENAPDSAIDITAEKDGEKYAFKCRYEIDAVGAKYIDSFAEACGNGNYDHKVYVTNSSFISSGKKSAEEKNIELWDRNTIDRMSIGIAENITDEEIPVKSNTGIIVTVIAVAVVVVAVALYWFVFRK